MRRYFKTILGSVRGQYVLFEILLVCPELTAATLVYMSLVIPTFLGREKRLTLK